MCQTISRLIRISKNYRDIDLAKSAKIALDIISDIDPENITEYALFSLKDLIQFSFSNDEKELFSHLLIGTPDCPICRSLLEFYLKIDQTSSKLCLHTTHKNN
jgi:hypothetical protein